jgi:hypothetical protein
VAMVMASASATGDVASAAAQPATAATAARLHATPDGNAAKGVNEPAGEAISPNGRTVFVTGTSGLGSYSDYATVAYSAATGRQLWSLLYSGSVHGLDEASAAAVRPSGSTVFVTGAIQGRKAGYEYATIAYSAATGTRQCVRLYNGAGRGDDVADAIAVSPTGTRVLSRDRGQWLRLRHGRLQRRRKAVVGPPLPLGGRAQRRQFTGREPHRIHGVRDRAERRPEDWRRLCHGRL